MMAGNSGQDAQKMVEYEQHTIEFEEYKDGKVI